MSMGVKGLSSAKAGMEGLLKKEKLKATSKSAKPSNAYPLWPFLNSSLVFLYRKTEEKTPVSHRIKPAATGNATRWQGYAALLGFGITRIRNHTRDKKPNSGKSR